MASRYSKLFVAALLTVSATVASAGDRNNAGSVLAGYAGSRQTVSASIAAARSRGTVVVASEAAPTKPSARPPSTTDEVRAAAGEQLAVHAAPAAPTKPSARMPSSTDEARGIGNAPAPKNHHACATACNCAHG